MNTSSRLVAVLAGFLAATAAHAANGDAAERDRIARERSGVEQRYEAAERECQRRFAVTDCLEGAQRERREAMLRLRREETLLDEVQRKQRAADRIEAIRRKVGAEAQGRTPAAREPRVAAPARAPAASRDATAADEAASASPLRRGRVTVRQRSAAPAAAADRAAQEARSRAAFEARQSAARDRIEENRRRNDERNQGKPPAAPLPTASGAAR